MLISRNDEELSLRIERCLIDKFLKERKECKSHIIRELRYKKKVFVIIKTL